ncbi:TniB family NTP-binding protein [Shewanella acanthi]|uniref:TniB family NTP-binding protein n=1 Tax=Shewanella acanthi TaxID=2864212 RepID=UPI001C655099|nr:TniB family NTP-binding protein [Shewanella acanthi]QYJ80484.1 TniB family NTP-binding protein [Shewanella acanthi]
MLIFGNSGSGISELKKSYASCFPEIPSFESTIKRVLSIDVREHTLTPIGLMEQIIEAIGATPVKDTRGSKIRHQCLHLLKEHRVELMLFDEAQHLLPEKEGAQGLRMVKFFTEMIDQFKIPFVLFGTHKAKRIQSFGQHDLKPIDDEQLSRRMFPPVELEPLKPRTSQWVKCMQHFLNKHHISTDYANESIRNRLFLAQQYKTFSHLAMLFEEHQFMNISNSDELLLELKRSYDKNLNNFGVNPFDESKVDEQDVLDLLTLIRRKMETE